MTDAAGLRFRPIEIRDTSRIHEWASNPDACRYQPWGPNTAEQTAAFVEQAVTATSDPASHRSVWVAVTHQDSVVGLGELHIVSATTREISYAVHTEQWGRGYGTQIGGWLITRAFTDSAVERVQATCDPRNTGSMRVLERAGMTYEGTLRHALRLSQGWRDSRMYSILREEHPRAATL